MKNEETPRDRSGRPDIDSQEEAWPQQIVIGNDEAELELSVESRSFVNRVIDQVRKRQKRISNVTENGEKHSMIWGMFMAVTMESATFMGKNFQNNLHSIVNTTDLTLKQMFDISAKLVTEQDEISNVDTIRWEKHSWKYLSLIGDETIINLQSAKVYVFSDSVLCLGKILENPESNDAWEQRLGWLKSFQNYRNFDRINGEPMEFEWKIFPGFNTLQLSEEVKSLLYRLGETPENFTRRILFMSMFNDISYGTKDNEKECLANARFVSLYARKFGTGQWSFIGLGSEKKWYSIKEDSPQGIWDKIEIRRKRMSNFPCCKSIVQRSTHKQRPWKTVDSLCCRPRNNWTIFRTSVSASQLSLYGAVANMCEEFESHQDRSGQPDVLMGQSIVLSEIKTEVPLDSDDPAYRNFLLQRYEERIKSLSQTDRVSKFCMDAGFLSVVEIGQYFMTKDNGEQFYAKACREYTLPRNDGSSPPIGWIQGKHKNWTRAGSYDQLLVW